MRPSELANATRVLGESQGYVPLPIFDYETPDGHPAMGSVWLLNEAERMVLVNGGHIRLDVLGTQHPPIILSVITAEEDTHDSEKASQ